jgi:hypothetical protein
MYNEAKQAKRMHRIGRGIGAAAAYISKVLPVPCIVTHVLGTVNSYTDAYTKF